jgi:hypothetical protein
MSNTKELWERSEPATPTQQKEIRDYTNNLNLYPRMDEDEDLTDEWRERQEELFEEQMNAYFENRYEY